MTTFMTEHQAQKAQWIRETFGSEAHWPMNDNSVPQYINEFEKKRDTEKHYLAHPARTVPHMGSVYMLADSGAVQPMRLLTPEVAEMRQQAQHPKTPKEHKIKLPTTDEGADPTTTYVLMAMAALLIVGAITIVS